MNRRGFLGAILATATAPAIVSSGIIMPVRKIVTPEWVGVDFAIDEPNPRDIELWYAWRKLKLNSEYGKFGGVTFVRGDGAPAVLPPELVLFYKSETARRVSDEISDTLERLLQGDRRSFELQADRCATTARDLHHSSVTVPRR